MGGLGSSRHGCAASGRPLPTGWNWGITRWPLGRTKQGHQAKGGAPMVDSGIERAWVASLIADPSRHDLSTVSLQDLGDPHARAAFEAFANVP